MPKENPGTAGIATEEPFLGNNISRIYGKIWPKPSRFPLGSGHILPYIPPLVLIRIQYPTSSKKSYAGYMARPVLPGFNLVGFFVGSGP